MPATKKSKGKTKSAVTGKYVRKSEVKDNPRETFVEASERRRGTICLQLTIGDLRFLHEVLGDLNYLWSALARRELSASGVRIRKEIERAIKAHKNGA